MKQSKILCPVDFSDSSRVAFSHAADMAAAQGAELVLMHVTPPPPTYDSGWAGFGALPPFHPEPDSRLDEWTDSRIEIRRVHLAGLVGESIVKFAEQDGCGLIVMGAHGFGAVKRFLFGSVSEFVLRHAKCPVIVVRNPTNLDAEASQETTAATADAT